LLSSPSRRRRPAEARRAVALRCNLTTVGNTIRREEYMERKKSKKTKRPRAVRDLTTRKAGPIKGKAGGGGEGKANFNSFNDFGLGR
jgi:hypothetical protein